MDLPTRVRAVILDVDGTLVRSNDAHAHAWVRALAEGGHDVPYENVRRLIGMGGDKVIPELTGLDPDGASGRLISARRRRIFADEYLPMLVAQPGARHLVQLLKQHGVSAVVASSAEKGELESLLKVAGVDDLVQHSVSKDDAGQSKPDPDPIRAALDFLGLPPHDVLMIGDTPYDIEAAARAGVATIAFRCGGWSAQDLADAVAVYDDPQDLANDYEGSPLAGRHVA